MWRCIACILAYLIYCYFPCTFFQFPSPSLVRYLICMPACLYLFVIYLKYLSVNKITKGRILLFSLSLQNNNGLLFVLLLPCASCGPWPVGLMHFHIWKCFCPKNFHFNLNNIVISSHPSSPHSRYLFFVDFAKSWKIPWPLLILLHCTGQRSRSHCIYYYYYYPWLYLPFDIVHTIVVQLCLMKSSHYNQILFFFLFCCSKCSYNSIK